VLSDHNNVNKVCLRWQDLYDLNYFEFFNSAIYSELRLDYLLLLHLFVTRSLLEDSESLG
jgi:hypothetical protein